MAKRQDIAIDSNNDVVITSNGDFAIRESDQQHVMDTINAWPGWWKEYPLDGVAVMSYLNSSSGAQLLARKIKIELSSDGYQVDNPLIDFGADGKLKINPNADRI